jgi:hypothetical protein
MVGSVLGIVFLASGWLFFRQIYNFPDYRTGAIIWVFAAMVFLIDYVKHIPQVCDLKRRDLINGLFVASILLVSILCVQFIILNTYVVIASRFHSFPALAPMINLLMNLFAIDGNVIDNVLILQTNEQLVKINLSLENFGLLIALMMTASVLVMVYYYQVREPFKTTAFLLLSSLIYLVLRFIFLSSIFAAMNRPGDTNFPYKGTLFWDQFVLFLSFIPLGMVWLIALPIRIKPILLKRIPFSKSIQLFLFIAVATFCTLGFLHYHDPGIKKQGRILFDDYHSGVWEKTENKLEKFSFGTESLYNYNSLAMWLKYYYPVVDINSGNAISAELLNKYDVLVLKTPTKKFTSAEISAILTFVENGGGLFVAGDHSNLLGMTTFFNTLIKHFGMAFNYDACNQLSTGYYGSYRPPALFAHALTKDIPNKFTFLTSCSMTAPILSENVMITGNLFGDKIDYSQPSFFGNMIPTPDNHYGLFLSSVALRHGKGRVVVFTDSTVLSSFCLFMEGHSQYSLNLFEYLNHENRKRSFSIKALFLFLGVITLVGAIVFCFKVDRPYAFLSISFGIMVSYLITGYLFDIAQEKHYPIPVPFKKYERISFLRQNCDYTFTPAIGQIFEPEDMCFATFAVASQRCGYFPSIDYDLDQSIRKNDGIVLINQIETFNSTDKRKLYDYLNSGGNILVVTNRFGKYLQAANDTLVSYDIQVHIGTGSDPSITGADLLLMDKENNVEIAAKRVGKGKIIVALDAIMFSRLNMGHVMMENPSDKMLSMYKKAYFLFERLLSL